jgi:hypothetical protein
MNRIVFDGMECPIQEAELHFPIMDGIRMMYMAVESSLPEAGSFRIWGIELALLDDLDDLNGKRIHIMPNGEAFDDDTLGTDIIGVQTFTDQHYWDTAERPLQYGEIMMEFHRIRGQLCRIHGEITLTESDEDAADLPPEAFDHFAVVDFEVLLDKKKPNDG